MKIKLLVIIISFAFLMACNTAEMKEQKLAKQYNDSIKSADSMLILKKAQEDIADSLELNQGK